MRDDSVPLGQRRTTRRGVLRGAVGAALGLTLAGGALTSGAVAAPRKPALALGPKDWMAALPDSRGIDDLVIPGTHNSCATVGGPFDTAKCQELSLPELLDLGVRYLDIRCRPIDGAFTIHHGAVYQKKNFHDVLSDCRTFLTANPGETVLMSVKKEHSDASDEEFASIFNDLYMDQEGFDDLVYRESDGIPTLGDVRGKVVLIARQPDIGGLDWGDTGLLSVQDDYQLPVAEKWARVQEHLDGAAEEGEGASRLWLNYVSTTTGEPIPLPSRYAEELNPMVEERLRGEYDAGEHPLYGAVILDFAGTAAPGLPEAIYQLNAAG
ncbi:phosphatidylinositol-specific phospholipase C [Streptomyces sp. NPDC005438]|uniref:phosphatidylinositol-specific phospholipase C n=1 Tax=Streptomyces sp. NPDC005438 TaxID=3156880 RepID=UPI0033B454FF